MVIYLPGGEAISQAALPLHILALSKCVDQDSCTEQVILVAQAFPADFDPFKLKLYHCEREPIPGATNS
jgi:hypothetical protein